ncbi:hypothetical protein FRB98_002945 [Tulasnella sp. 332]|nr:hypothetical protein FRB98_002945 [Tulasnella sp. 332]
MVKGQRLDSRTWLTQIPRDVVLSLATSLATLLRLVPTLRILNNPSDLCLWDSPIPNGLIGDIEASSVAWCIIQNWGTGVMPANAITASQFLVALDYVQVTGLINQGNINEDPKDSGEELDPHGADVCGNPLRALVFSNAFPQSNGVATNMIQAIE